MRESQNYEIKSQLLKKRSGMTKIMRTKELWNKLKSWHKKPKLLEANYEIKKSKLLHREKAKNIW